LNPVAGNMGVVPPKRGFFRKAQKTHGKNGIVLIFDEVITGFRFTFGGYQNLAGINPDLTCLGKIIGGGMPVGAIGGKEKSWKTRANGEYLSGGNTFRKSSGHDCRLNHAEDT